MKENNLRVLKSLILVSFLFCLYLQIFVRTTGCNFEKGLAWGNLTPVSFFLAWAAYQLTLIWKSEAGHEKDIVKVKIIGFVLVVIIFWLIPFLF